MATQPPPEGLYEHLTTQPAPNAHNAEPVPQQQPPQQQYPPQQPPQQQYPPQQPPQQQYPPQQPPQQQHPQQQQNPQQPPPQPQQQYQVIVQTAPQQYGSCSKPYENYLADQSVALGGTQIAIGGLCIVFNIVGIILLHQNEDYNYFIGYEWIFYSGYGIWNGLFFILAGAFGVGARSKNPCPVIAFMVLSIVAAVMTMFVIGFASGGIAETRYVGDRYNNRGEYYYGVHWYDGDDNDSHHNGKMAMHALMLLLAFVELVVSIWSSAICCHAACCCRDRGTVHAAPVVQYGQPGQPGQPGQQQVFIHTTGGQPQPYYVQQPGGAYPGGSGMTQQPGPAMPPAYNSASAPPPAYGGPPQDKSGGGMPAPSF